MRGSKEPLTAFITGQKAAIRHGYQNAQKNWIHVGRHRVRTQAQADALEATLTEEAMSAAADVHYIKSRDAWITYLAQMRFGVLHSKALDENYDIVDLGPTTDLIPTSEREVSNELHPGMHSTTDSPDLAQSLLGMAHGVLSLAAKLPAIRELDGSGYYGMSGAPRITNAYLNGVNEIIRQQFVGKPLSLAHIPRVVRCEVEDGEDFEIRINEKGLIFSGRENPWIRARAIVGKPWNVGQPAAVLEQLGVDLLLADLVPPFIEKGISE
jgi:hypothetical protein